MRSNVTYGSVAFGCASKIQIERLQFFQNKQLRSYTRATHYARYDIIHKDLNIRIIFAEI